MIKNLFEQDGADEIIARINELNPNSQRLWGTMNPSQMLAHCNVAYACTFTPENFSKPNFLMKFVLKNFVKNNVVNPNPYKKNQRTSPDFVIVDACDFDSEKSILIANVEKVQRLGKAFFEDKESFSFGKMSAEEWNIMFYKHLDHHLKQFGT